MRDARSEDARDAWPDAGDGRPGSDAQPGTGDAQPPDAAPMGECTFDSDCEQRGLSGAICVDAACWQPDAPDACDSDEACTALGPEYVGGRCVDGACRPNPRWRCPTPAAPSEPELTLKVLLRDALSFSALANVRAAVCQKLDLECVDPIATITSDAMGYFTFTVPRDFAGYLETEDPRFFPALYFLPKALPSEELQPFPLLAVGVVDALALSLGDALDVGRGHLILVAEDCFGLALEGVSFESAQADAATIQFYVRDVLPSTDATETGEIGNGGYINFPAGNAVINARLVATELPLATFSVVVRPSFITVAYVRPELR